MMLPPIPPDPEPTKSELARYFADWRGLDGWLLRSAAQLSWCVAGRQQSPNNFRAPFPPDDYKSYLDSPLWMQIRTKVLDQAGYRCAVCRKKATQVHHRDYRPRILAGDDISLLVPVCRKCHRNVHKTADGKMRESWDEQECTLREMVEANDPAQ
jgi:5-methylcytosine-specific restriction endonuclease McrA